MASERAPGAHVVQTTLDGLGRPVGPPPPPPPRHRSPRLADPNPCVAVYGPGPAGATCATCAALVYTTGGHRAYPKCRRRGVDHRWRLDHRTGWPACARYERKEATDDGN